MEERVDRIIFEAEEQKYTLEDLIACFKKCNLESGDSCFIHSDLGHFGKLVDIKEKDRFTQAFVDAFFAVLGPNGNMIVPTFSYSFCNNELFDVKNTPSRVGIFSEYFRNLPDTLRSIHPIFSVTALGPRKKYFCSVGKSSFGKDSIFHKLFQEDVKLVFLGETFDITYMHYIEQEISVPYRFMKQFKGKMKIDGQVFDDICDYYVKEIDKNIKYDLEKIATYFDSKRILTTVQIGYSKIRVVGAVDVAVALKEILKKDIYFLLRSVPSLKGINKDAKTYQ